MTRPRLRAAVAATFLVSGLASGCAVFSEQTTQLDYTPSDGAQADVAQLQVRNLFFVAADAEAPGTLVGVFLNAGGEDLDVTLTSDNGAEASFTVDAGEQVSLGPDADEQVDVDSVGVVPGQTVPVTVSIGEEVVIPTPVLDGALPEYADLVPTAGPSS